MLRSAPASAVASRAGRHVFMPDDAGQERVERRVAGRLDAGRVDRDDPPRPTVPTMLWS